MKKRVLLYLTATPDYGGIYNYCIFILKYFYRVKNVDLTVIYSSKSYEKYLNNKSKNFFRQKKTYLKFKIFLFYLYNFILLKKIIKKIIVYFLHKKKVNYDYIFFYLMKLFFFHQKIVRLFRRFTI